MNKIKVSSLLSFLLLLSITNNSFGMFKPLKRLFRRRKKKNLERNADLDQRLLCFATRRPSGKVGVYGPATRVLRKLSGSAKSAAFSPDGRLVAFAIPGAARFEMTVLDRQTWRTIASDQLYCFWVKALAFSPDGKFLAVSGEPLVGNEHSILIFDIVKEAHVCGLRRIPSKFSSIAAGRGNEYLWGVSTGQGAGVYKWDLRSKQLVESFPMSFLMDDARLSVSGDNVFVAGASRGCIMVRNVTSDRVIKIIKGYNPRVSQFGFCPDSEYFYHFGGSSGETKRRITTVNLETGEEGLLGEFELSSSREKLLALCLVFRAGQEQLPEGAAEDEQERLQFLFLRQAQDERGATLKIPKSFLLQ